MPDLASHFVFVNLVLRKQFSPMRMETGYEKARSWGARACDDAPGHADVQTTVSIYGWVTQDAEMRSSAQWRIWEAGWMARADGR